ncbi:DUF1266 domain-containing protein [Schaalia hyovaginalis]|uniref:DUF1266 domain-containing protein n=1 Tax=Schaalia hyovaginalis TaxID=29316 RepID=UPI0012B3EBC1|nr:DUF1266 domain-containing protein [Schaalia hyovaginalis]MCI7670949.1 DUF1266 domain-containing protein [Schaalia hyovaginalis]MDY4491990.1 DUF1266 domain-containing protein [Schaalia hyovaginalis]MST64780.1 DUF1266 domain-containing protein [Schaalia hyovaginalis]
MEALTSMLGWFFAPENRLIMWIVLGLLGLVVVYFLLTFFARFSKLAHNKAFTTEGREANLLALGFQQITNSLCYWNDPTASLLSSKACAELREMWGLNSIDDVHENVERLLVGRRRRESWQRLLALRAQAAAANGGLKPSSRQWLATIKESGGTGEGAERDFVNAVEFYENAFGKKHFPADEPVFSFDAYALGQAVAVCVWSVKLGLISREASMRMIEEVNRAARTEFDSWSAFGRSYALGRAMHWSDGAADEKRASESREAVTAMEIALDGKKGGPWGLLDWRLPAD